MAHFYFLIAVAVLLVLSFVASLWRGARRRAKLPYLVDGAFLADDQLRFLAVLRRALGDGFDVFARVRAIDVIGLTGRLSKRQREQAVARVDQRFFDFLICRNDNSEILGAVNLVAPSRLRKSLPKDSLEPICAAAGLPFLRFLEASAYSVDEVSARLFEAIERPVVWTEEVLPEEDAMQALQGLTATIKGERGSPKPVVGRERQVPAVKGQVATSKPKDPLDELLEDSAQARREPSIRRFEPVDEGPEFHIPADLDDDGLDQAEVRRRRA